MTDTPNPSAAGSVAAPTDPVTALAARRLADRFPGVVIEQVLGGRHPFLCVGRDRLVEICTFLRDDPELKMDGLHLLSGVDWPAKTPADGAGSLEVVYHLVSYSKRPDPAYRKATLKTDPFLSLKVRVPRDQPEVPSVMGVWIGADWHERETYDLLGVRFTGRPALRRILLPEDWPGHPLRKDWEYPVEYHGIPIIPPEGR